MTTERAIRIIAGGFILISVYLAWQFNNVPLKHPTWLWLTLFVGANLFQSGITCWCLMETLLRKLGMRSSGIPGGKI